MIPKVIHWCWFGRGKKTPLVEKCLASWKKYLPEYRIKEWNEDNFDINFNQYVKEAYESRKWAFVTDYVRLYALYHEGGVYMDSDVEVLKPLDKFLSLPAFSGRDSVNGSLTGTMGSEKGGKWVEELLKDYDNRHFIKSDGTFDLTTNVVYTDHRMEPLGLTHEDVEFEIPGYVKLFRQEVFCPKSWQDRRYAVTDNSYTIHHFATSWHSPRAIRINKIRDRFGLLPARIYSVFWDRPDKVAKHIFTKLLKH